MYYILDKQGKPTPVPEEQFRLWYDGSKKCRMVGRTRVGSLTVLTNFVGADYNDSDPPALWETTVANRKHHEILSERCAGTREQAEAMHGRVVRRLTRAQKVKRKSRYPAVRAAPVISVVAQPTSHAVDVAIDSRKFSIEPDQAEEVGAMLINAAHELVKEAARQCPHTHEIYTSEGPGQMKAICVDCGRERPWQPPKNRPPSLLPALIAFALAACTLFGHFIDSEWGVPEESYQRAALPENELLHNDA
jgi:hypothetical protein